jgi:acetyl esterase/lipase
MRMNNEPITVVYKRIDDLDLHLDLYPPTSWLDQPRPALVYFHGGGLTVGDRTSWFPQWLHGT